MAHFKVRASKFGSWKLPERQEAEVQLVKNQTTGAFEMFAVLGMKPQDDPVEICSISNLATTSIACFIHEHRSLGLSSNIV